MNNFCSCKNCEDEIVYLMSAGYEWECPHCSHLNTVIEIPKKLNIQCEHCRTEYPLMGEEHSRE